MRNERSLPFLVEAFGGCVVLAILGGFLIPHTDIGVGWAMFLTLSLAMFAWLSPRAWAPPQASLRWLVAPLAIFSAFLLWRDSPTLNALALTAIVLCTGYGLLKARQGSFFEASLVDVPFTILGRALGTLVEGSPVMTLLGQWGRVAGSSERVGRLRPLMRGLGLAAPFLLVFGWLFRQSDAAFERSLGNFGSFSMQGVPEGLATSLVAFLVLTGTCVGLFVKAETPRYGPPRAPSFGLTEVAVVLVLLNVLFLGFVALQSSYLFGGEAAMRAVAGLTVAEYARRGFFELVTVAGLALALLLAFAHTLSPQELRRWHLFPRLAGLLIASVGIILASATQRMVLYVGEFGVSELRVYVFAILIWLAGVLGWFGFTVLRGHERRFAPGALAGFLLAVLGLHVANPDAWIARINLTRERSTLDQTYLTTLSADAIPVLREAAQRDASLTKIRSSLESRPPILGDWRGWSVSRHVAARSLGR